jgi:tryptophan synthase alpha chain
MSILSAQFDKLKAKNEKALVLFVTAGDPPLDQLSAILAALEEGGADVIELGIPFSDPIADGPTIQASSQRALDSGVTPTAVLETLGKVKLAVPVVLMGYYNPVLKAGLSKFAEKAYKSGASATIMCDITPDEAGPWIEASRHAGLDNVFLAAPTSTDERLDAVCAASTGFVYAVSRTGVTGALETVPEDVQTLVGRLKSRTQLPVCVGFGISKPEHVKSVCRVADGAVIGSWLVDLISRHWHCGSGRADIVEKVKALKAATVD